MLSALVHPAQQAPSAIATARPCRLCHYRQMKLRTAQRSGLQDERKEDRMQRKHTSMREVQRCIRDHVGPSCLCSPSAATAASVRYCTTGCDARPAHASACAVCAARPQCELLALLCLLLTGREAVMYRDRAPSRQRVVERHRLRCEPSRIALEPVPRFRSPQALRPPRAVARCTSRHTRAARALWSVASPASLYGVMPPESCALGA